MKKTIAILTMVFLLALMALEAAQADGINPAVQIEPTVGGLFPFGHYEQDNDKDNDPANILWVVLELDDEKMVLLSRDGLAARPYNEEGGDATWESCSLRQWLNGDFLNEAFSEEEQAMLATVGISADGNPEYPGPAGNDTEDRVYLPSIQEVEAWDLYDNLSFCYPSNHAMAHGARRGMNGACSWWLRTPGREASNVACVSDYGHVFAEGISSDRGDILVRPMITVRLPEREAESAAPDALSWRGYDLLAAWLTTDPSDIGIPNLRTDGQFALVRLEPAEGTADYETINEYAGDDIFLRLAGGDKVPVATLMFHQLIHSEGSGFPSIAPEQDNFDALFFLEGGSEADLEGAALVVVNDGAEQAVALDAISREKPTPEAPAGEQPE